jgi:predicted AlkP superfamily phosphohydrolase/phosphomutase
MIKKVFIFGIDSATLDIVMPEIRKGNLENFKRLLEQGSYGKLSSTMIVNSAVAWTTFMTGKNPGKHGIYDFFKVDSYSPNFISFSDIGHKPFWDILGEMGKKSFVINVPLTYPVSIKNGVIISGLQTPLDRKDFVYPGDFWEEVKRISPEYKVFPSTKPEEDLRKHIEEIDVALESQLQLVWYIFKEKEWDLLVYVMQNIDILQHYLWHYIDHTHSRYKDDGFFSKELLRFYQKIDVFLGRIIDAMDDDMCLLVFSDHGAGKAEGYFSINNWLLKNGFLSLKNKPSIIFKKWLMKFGICEADLYNFFIADNPLFRLMRIFNKGKKIGKKNRTFYKMGNIDWKKTLAYGMTINQIFINLKGREAEGIVEQGEVYERVRQDLIERLMKVRHPYKDRPLIDRIYKKEEIFFGEELFKLPDLIFTCDNFEINSLSGYKISFPGLFSRADIRTGWHRSEGLIFCYGKGVNKGFRVSEAYIRDIPATIMALLGNVLPEDFDGRVLAELFVDGDLKIVRKENICTKKEKNKDFSYFNNEQIKKVLESLGYI